MKRILFLFIVAGSFIFSRSYSQSTKIYIKVSPTTSGPSIPGGFDGGSTAEGHPNEIEALSYSYGLAGCTNATLGSGSSSCKIAGTPFVFSMGFNTSLISFKNAVLLGRHVNVDVAFVKQGGEPFTYYRIHMENVNIVSVQEEAGGEAPTVSIELKPQKVAWQILTQLGEGGTLVFSYGWDFGANKPYPFPTF